MAAEKKTAEKSDLSRRDLLRGAGAAAAGAGFVPVSALAAHSASAQASAAAAGSSERKTFNEQQFQTLRKLADWIIPPDEKSQGGDAGGTAELIDLMASVNRNLARSFHAGLGWLDSEMRRRGGKTFLESSADEQKQMLDLLAYRKNDSPELGPGIRFFALMRRWTADAFYSSKEGVADLGFEGNTALSEYNGCGEDVVQQLLGRSPI